MVAPPGTEITFQRMTHWLFKENSESSLLFIHSEHENGTSLLRSTKLLYGGRTSVESPNFVIPNQLRKRKSKTNFEHSLSKVII
uniref:Uncharacterized protein n=1 Tax=Glossina palpalis gambiensis TaxID=67801 RepID=A0A1B0BIQ0_9MUSC